MKHIYSILTTFLICLNLSAQTPQAISYQAVLRNSSNELISNKTVGIQISILQGGADGPAIYSETHTALTNVSGLISIHIGNGNTTYGVFTDIEWGSDTYFIKTETDPDGGSNYSITGISQLLSVPYALHAKTAEKIVSGGFSIDIDVTNASKYEDDADGEISIVFNGGSTPYKYIFTEANSYSDFDAIEGNTYSNLVTLKELESGYYEFYVEDNNGVSTQRKIYVGHNSPIVYISNIQPSCSNSATGSFEMKIEGGTPGYQYRVNGGTYKAYDEQGVTISNVIGHIDIDVYDANGYEGVVFAEEINDGEGSSFDIPYYKPNVLLTVSDACNGSDGAISVEIADEETGQPFVYQWYEDWEMNSLISEEKDLINVARDNYYLKIINNDGCESDRLKASVGYSFDPEDNSNSTCQSINIEPYNYTGEITYEWSDSEDFSNIISTEQDLSNVDGNKEYYLRMTNEKGCISNTRSYYLESYFYTDINYNVSNPCQGGKNGSVDITVNYFEGETLSYEWSTDEDFNEIISTEEDLTGIGIADGEYFSDYYLRMTNEKGCKSETYSFWIVNESFSVELSSEVTYPCSGASNGSINITPDYEGTLTYEWTTDEDFTNIISTEKDLIGVGTPENNYYYLRISNEDGCQTSVYSYYFYSESFSVTLNEEISHPCTGASNGSINITPDYNGTLTYEWATDYNFTNIISTDEDLVGVGTPENNYYYLRISNEDGCQTSVYSFDFYSESFSVTLNEEISRPCSGVNNGSINITPDYDGTLTYEWATDEDFTNIISTEEDLANIGIDENSGYNYKYYYLRVTSEDGCQFINNFQVYQSYGFDTDFTYFITESCEGENNGSINISFSNYEGELSYEWAVDEQHDIIIANSEDISNLASSEWYYLKVNNNIGCPRTYEFFVGSFHVSLDSYVTNASSTSATDGSIQISVQDEGTYTYEWATDWDFTNIISTEEDLLNLAPGNYILRITDTNGNGCQVTRSWEVGSKDM